MDGKIDKTWRKAEASQALEAMGLLRNKVCGS